MRDASVLLCFGKSEAERLVAIDHTAERPTHFGKISKQSLMLKLGDVFAGESRLQPVHRFLQFAIGIRQLAEEMRRITALGP